MLIPAKIKHRKQQRGKMPGNATRGSEVIFGYFGLKATSRGLLTSRQIESARRAMTRYIKRGGKVFIRVFPDKPITKSAAETPMGGGKGTLDHFAVVVKPGTVMFEMDGVIESVAKEAMRLASYKLPVDTKFITKD
ncbi:MAG: 50S ribosomal protein L16 [Patescibacteria group bacterium]|jgi:large subunit ribosomal protein L16